jgi:ActR/RegA family two-component response regulator
MQRQSKTILVVDDDRVFASSLASALQSCGYEVIDSSNATHAYSVLETQTVDLAVIDLDLPDKSGLELIHTASKTRKNTRILAVSGVLSDLHLNIAKYMGANEAIHKFSHVEGEPFPSSEWRAVVDDVLSESSGA